MALLVVVFEECYSKFYVAPTFRALLENCDQIDLDTHVRRLVQKTMSFRIVSNQRFDAKELMIRLCSGWCMFISQGGHALYLVC